ncbi:MAG: prepilin-type N-terminal cleavage/methylation domain-containing protein [Candidatus Binatales bacterium]
MSATLAPVTFDPQGEQSHSCAAAMTKRGAFARGFTLLEVMISVAILSIALVALLALDHQDLLSVIHAQDLSRASLLAQALMTQAEVGGFPDLGTQTGNFQQMYKGKYPNFKWRRTVKKSGVFPDVHEVTITVFYGPAFSDSFGLVEFVHDPNPPETP